MDKELFEKIKNTLIIDFNKDKTSVNDYLEELISTLIVEGEEFNSKRPLGDSSWHYVLGKSLAVNGIIDYTADYWDSEDPNDWDVSFDNNEAQEMFLGYIKELFGKDK